MSTPITIKQIVFPTTILSAVLTAGFALSGCRLGAIWCAISTYVAVQAMTAFEETP